ncbi:unnamed protein product [Nippostrongylus brasiliensis]|uniref:Integrase catalytic domain-containing protein n=1 Tax=Nippostrongylus brasiliensis TaxID=27835 RepID=A0A0N4XZZ6_NIPBR|nr:unnamed protein product [Nippostrongylus brasiliensis]
METILILRFKRLPFGVTTSPYLLAISIKYALGKQENKVLAKEVERNLYVDNVFLTANDSQTLINKYHESKRIFKNMSMNLQLSDISCSLPLTHATAQDMIMAERICVRLAQHTIILTDKLRNLDVFRENGLLRCNGRLRNSNLPIAAKTPILLPPNHDYTTLIITDVHKRLGHQGANSTLANLRLQFWIPTGRRTVQKVINRCVTCKRWNSRPYHYPNSPALPSTRTTPSRAFEHVGIDLAGPFLIKEDENTMTTKFWVCLFTCMTTRAVHLEAITALSGTCFVNCLRRFVARRGKPKTILSDNATNFKWDYIPSFSCRKEAIHQFDENRLHLTRLWNIWTEQYLLDLRNHHQKRIKQNQFTRTQPKIGEVVLIFSEETPRGKWPLDIVTELKVDPDNEIREATIRMAPQKTIQRSINMLIPLELDDENLSDCENENSNEMVNENGENGGKQSNSETSMPNNEDQHDKKTDLTYNTRQILPRKAKENVRYSHVAFTHQDDMRRKTVMKPISWFQ